MLVFTLLWSGLFTVEPNGIGLFSGYGGGELLIVFFLKLVEK